MRKFTSLVGTLIVGVLLNVPFSAQAEESVILKVNGVYCQFCVSSTMMKLKNAPGVSNIVLWMADGKIKITPTAGNRLDPAELSSILSKSSYNLVDIEFRANGHVQKSGHGWVFIASDTGNRYPISNASALQGNGGYVQGTLSSNGSLTVVSMS